MTSNHEEYSNDITLENLKWKNNNQELEVIEFAFSNFRYNNKFSVPIHILQNSIHELRVLLTCVTISCVVLQL